MVLALFIKHQPMLNAKLKDRIRDALTQHFKRPIQLDIIVTAEEQHETPNKRSTKANEQRVSNIKQSVMQDPQLKQLIEQYGATIEVL